MVFDWDPEKNEGLKVKRGISFEKIIFHLSQGDLWKIADHPDHKRYPGQKIYFVKVDDYIYLVPYIKKEKKVFLKTIIPSRKATRDYKRELEKKNEIR